MGDEDDIFYDDGEEDEDELEARCWARYLKGSQRVYERTLYHIRGRTYRDALMILEFVRWTESKAVLTALQSAAANAQNQKNMDKSRLYISECKAVKGPYEKRFKKVAGRMRKNKNRMKILKKRRYLQRKGRMRKNKNRMKILNKRIKKSRRNKWLKMISITQRKSLMII